MQFVQIPADLLDQGLGGPLLRLLRRAGATDGQRLAFLCSDPVHQALTLGFEDSVASSLPAETAFAQTKRSEAPRLCHVATVHFPNALPLRWFTELDALADKTAQVLAHSLHRVVAMRGFIAQNSARLHVEVDRRRACAKSASQRGGVGSLAGHGALMIGWARGRKWLKALTIVKDAFVRWANWTRASSTLRVRALRVVRRWLWSRRTASGRRRALEVVFEELYMQKQIGCFMRRNRDVAR